MHAFFLCKVVMIYSESSIGVSLVSCSHHTSTDLERQDRHAHKLAKQIAYHLILPVFYRIHLTTTLVISLLMKKSKFTVCDRMTQGCNDRQQKNHYHKGESIPCCLLSRQAHLLAFEASGIQFVPLTFKASVMSTAPVVLHYTSSGTQCESEVG